MAVNKASVRIFLIFQKCHSSIINLPGSTNGNSRYYVTLAWR